MSFGNVYTQLIHHIFLHNLCCIQTSKSTKFVHREKWVVNMKKWKSKEKRGMKLRPESLQANTEMVTLKDAGPWLSPMLNSIPIFQIRAVKTLNTQVCPPRANSSPCFPRRNGMVAHQFVRLFCHSLSAAISNVGTPALGQGRSICLLTAVLTFMQKS